ncbi:MAG: sigma-54-dependent Fis family transcriptional regulator [Calditrichaeota bacterium]|nr:MAG: sigma-54-dependent Fis family transcriptional regulator [Calditrichota bacterium]
MSVQPENIAILIVDDEQSIRVSLERVIRKEGYATFVAANAHEAEEILGRENISLVLTDMRMPGMSGNELLKVIKKNWPEIEVVVLTGHGTIEKAVEAMKNGAYDFVSKPFKRVEILHTIEKALERHALNEENRILKEQLAFSQTEQNKFIGKSKAVKSVLNMISRVAPLPSTVLITGESGTGKEIVARMLHAQSQRVHKRFVAVNCGAIAENLIESELFGHVKGSYTGATKDKEGLFKSASGGTLFLDEISTLPLNLQVKLLRAIQEQEIMPVGAGRTIPINVRIIAASNKNLEDEIANGAFREDLYYRLNVVGIYIPPLRDRRDDIPLLIDYFLQRFNRDMNKNISGVSMDAMPYFLGNEWKGNVRELENTIERAVILCDGDHITLDHLPQVYSTDDSMPVVTNQGLKEAVAEFEKMQITKVLEMVDSDKKTAAKMLGLSLSSLYRKMSELGLDTKDVPV